MKLEKDELIKKVNDLEVNDEIKISLLEDITDSFEKDTKEFDDLKSKYDDLVIKNEELTEKYKERFLEGSEVKTEEKYPEEMEEKRIIDIREI